MFDIMSGNIDEIHSPDKAYNRNGRYPNVFYPINNLTGTNHLLEEEKYMFH